MPETLGEGSFWVMTKVYSFGASTSFAPGNEYYPDGMFIIVEMSINNYIALPF